jgi:hypothetical protein
MIVQPSTMQRVAQAVNATSATDAPVRQLHAPDKPGEASYAAAQFATVIQMNLVIAASPTAELPARIDALEKLFTAWPALCREIARLSDVAPNSAAAGRRLAADLRDFTENQGASQ